MGLNTAFRQLTDDEQQLVDTIKEGAHDLFGLMETAFSVGKSNGREIALAKTNLEQAVMWGVKAVSAVAKDDQPEAPTEAVHTAPEAPAEAPAEPATEAEPPKLD